MTVATLELDELNRLRDIERRLVDFIHSDPEACQHADGADPLGTILYLLERTRQECNAVRADLNERDQQLGMLTQRHAGIRWLRQYYLTDVDAVATWVHLAQDRMRNVARYLQDKFAPRLERSVRALERLAQDADPETAVKLRKVIDDLTRSITLVRRAASRVEE